ncbi:hypothetical protein ACOSQ3_022690 [Xanthoceras sorbifolium]
MESTMKKTQKMNNYLMLDVSFNWDRDFRIENSSDDDDDEWKSKSRQRLFKMCKPYKQADNGRVILEGKKTTNEAGSKRMMFVVGGSSRPAIRRRVNFGQAAGGTCPTLGEAHERSEDVPAALSRPVTQTAPFMVLV